MLDYEVILVVIGSICIPLFVIVLNKRYRKQDKKDYFDEYKRLLEEKVLDTAAKKKVIEEETADKVRQANIKRADIVKGEMREYINSFASSLVKDSALEHEKMYSKIHENRMMIDQLNKDLDHYKEYTKGDIRELKHSIEFLQTVAWGPDAKSVPPYMLGEEQSQEHKDLPDAGAFETNEERESSS